MIYSVFYQKPDIIKKGSATARRLKRKTSNCEGEALETKKIKVIE